MHEKRLAPPFPIRYCAFGIRAYLLPEKVARSGGEVPAGSLVFGTGVTGRIQHLVHHPQPIHKRRGETLAPLAPFEGRV
jgi:hypothetical protein